MRLVTGAVTIFVCCVLLMQTQMQSRVLAVTPIEFSQTIQPLLCTVDIIAFGTGPSVSLSPAKCINSAQARQLLEDTKEALALI